MAPAETIPATPRAETAVVDLDVGPDDPLLSYLQSTSSVVELDRLTLDSPATRMLRAAGVQLIVPLVSQGELIGLINLGPRLSEQEYSTDDRKLLADLATHAAPAVRVAQLAREQQIEARERERLEQELRVARLIQQTLLPKELPDLPGWEIAAHYQPARAVGGDFYDFIYFPDGRLGLFVGDVTDKGVPAALVMATTRSILRAATERLETPGAVLKRANDLLHPDIPPKMFVTCFYMLLDPRTGRALYANAGHDLPYRRTANGVEELCARGMPLGLLPGMEYEELETTLVPGESVFFYSDGLVEAHAPAGEMFGFPRLQRLMGEHAGGAELIPFMLNQLFTFTGAEWEQEDDVTLVTLQRTADGPDEPGGNSEWQTLAVFDVSSAPGNERLAVQQVAEVVADLPLEQRTREKLQTAVAETTMNAIEYGNEFRPELPVHIVVRKDERRLSVCITDQGSGPGTEPVQTPNLEAKLAGEQTPRGWGLFLIQNMVDEFHTRSSEEQHTVELIIYLDGEEER